MISGNGVKQLVLEHQVKAGTSSCRSLCAGTVASIALVAKDQPCFSRWFNLRSNVAFSCFSWISVGRAGRSRPSRQTGSEADQADRQAGQILGPPHRGALQTRPLSLLRPIPKRRRREEGLRRAQGNEAAPLSASLLNVQNSWSNQILCFALVPKSSVFSFSPTDQ